MILRDRLSRYRREIVQDLAEQGWDVPLLFRRRRWRFLADLVDGLGPTSRMVSAMLNDPDLAEAIAAATDDEDEEAAPSSLRSQTPEAILLRGIFNLIVSALGGKETWPAPVTAVEWALPDLLADDD